ncbi:MAG: hypothetical protein GY765_41465 [bacterium]|nr:hypothetical protein [bacterium]
MAEKTAGKKKDTPIPPASGSGGCFTTSGRLLSFVSAVAGAQLTHEIVCRRSPKGVWWAEVGLSSEIVSHLVWTAGGIPYSGGGNKWIRITLSNKTDNRDRLDISKWQPVDLEDLLTETALGPGKNMSASQLYVVTPPSLSRWVLRRAVALGIHVDIFPGMRRPLGRVHQDSRGVLILRLSVEKGVIPLSLVRAVSDLPYITVARAVGQSGESLLVDIRYCPPLAESLLALMIPEKETWLLGGPDIGHWRLNFQGGPIDGATLLEAPDLPFTDMPVHADFQLPEPIPVRLTASGRQETRVDAVLLDDREMDWLRLILAGRPVGETAFLLLGQERHMLVSPGGLPEILPFGIPLIHLEPGGFFLEQGFDFYPALPETARKQTFQLEQGTVVAVVEEGAYRFDISHMVPAWTLWVGEPPEIKDGLSTRSKEILKRISAEIRKREAEQDDGSLMKSMERQIRQPSQPEDRGQVLAEAQQAELAGDFIRAAELLESIGDLRSAGRLFERAAMQTRD